MELTKTQPWLLSKRWDLIFLIGSALFVPLPLLIKNGFGLSVAFVNLAVTILIGGPHLFSTFTYTLLEKKFWKQYPAYAALAFLIPPLVIFLGLAKFSLLITIFFFWASVHILHQVCYLVDCYQAKQPARAVFPYSKAIDYLIVFTSIYPIASYKIVHDTFVVAGTHIRLPLVTGNPMAFLVMTSVFAVAVFLFLAKCLWEWRAGMLNIPKTLLISVTVIVSFLLPIPDDLDVTFQGFNTWHSLQYIALAWWINALRKERQEISSPLVRQISGVNRKAVFYLSCLVPTAFFLVLVGVVGKYTGWPHNQAYFIVVLSGLLMHYYFDHWIFTKVQAVVR